MANYPEAVDIVAALAGGEFLIPPGTRIYSLTWNSLTDIAVRFRFTTSQPWIVAREGDSYQFNPPIQTGIYLDVATTGASPAGVAIYSSSPCGLEVSPR